MRMKLKLKSKTEEVENFLNENMAKFGKLNCFKILNQEEISELLEREELINFVKMVDENNLSDNFELLLCNMEWEEYEDYEFIYDSFRKKASLALGKYNSIDKLEYIDLRYIAFMHMIEEYENIFNKNVLEFDELQQEQTILGLYNDIKAYYVVKNFILRNLIIEYEDMMTDNRSWERYMHRANIVQLLSEEDAVKVPTREDVYQLFNYVSSPQNGIIPILLFEGIKTSKIDDIEELRFLKQKDLHEDQLVIRDCNNKVKRSISIEQDTYDLIKIAIDFDEYYVLARNGSFTRITFYGDYILKKGVRESDNKSAMSKTDASAPLSYISIVKKNNEIREEAKKLGVNFSLTPSAIRDAGKIHYAKKFLKEGYSFIEATEMVGNRFGDLEGKDAVYLSSYRAKLREKMRLIGEDV